MSNVLRLFCATLLGLLPQAVGAEEKTVYSAPYEVIEGDPSCNGPHERLVRVRFRVPDLAEALRFSNPQCSVRERREGTIYENVIPCPPKERGSSQEALPVAGRYTLSAEVAICQSPWRNQYTSISGGVSDTQDNTTITYPLVYQDWNNSSIKTEQDSSKLPWVKFFLWCSKLPWKPIVVHFDLNEESLSACDNDSCLVRIATTEEEAPIAVAFDCADPVQDPTQ